MRGSILRLRVDAFGVGGCARTSHTPGPSGEGRLRCCVLLVMRDLWRGSFPSREGIKGCVTVRCAAWDECFLLLFGEEVSVSFE